MSMIQDNTAFRHAISPLRGALDPEKGLEFNPDVIFTRQRESRGHSTEEIEKGSRNRETQLPQDNADDMAHNGDEDDDVDMSGPEEIDMEQPTRSRTQSSPARGSPNTDIAPSTCWSRFKRFVFPPTPHPDSLNRNYRLTPILSGIIIPFSILLEIPGLTQHWYIRTDTHNIVATRPISVLLEIGLGISMFSALAANFFLILRFLEKRVKTMTIISVLFLTLHDVINITALTLFSVQHHFHDGFTYGQAFWLTVCSTAASLFTNVTLIYDLYSTPDFEKSGSGLTHKQRSLVVIVIILLACIAIGALANSILMHLSFINALYFSVVVISTIGFGDIVPETTGARIWVSFYACIGIVNLLMAVKMTRETVLEALVLGYWKRVRAVKERRRQASRKRRAMRRWRRGIEWRLRQMDAPMWVRDHHRTGISSLIERFEKCVEWLFWKLSGRMWRAHDTHSHRGSRLNLEALAPPQLEAAAMEAGVPLAELLPRDFAKQLKNQSVGQLPTEGSRSSRGKRNEPQDDVACGRDEERGTPTPGPLTLTHARMGRMIAMLGRFALALQGQGAPGHGDSRLPGASRLGANPVGGHVDDDAFSQQSMYASATDLDRTPSMTQRKESFKANMEKVEKKAFYIRLTGVWTFFLVFWTIGSAIFSATEGWSYATALYFCVIAFTTIGFGDFAPVTPAGRTVFVIWALLGMGTMTILSSIIVEASSKGYKSMMHAHAFDKAVKRYKERAKAMAEAHLAQPSRYATGVTFSRSATIDSEYLRPRPLRRGVSMTRSTTIESENPRLYAHRNLFGGVSMSRSGTLESNQNYMPPILPRILPASVAEVRSSEGVEESRSHISLQLHPPGSHSVSTTSSALQELQLRIQSHLEALPKKMLDYAGMFHQRMQFFIGQDHSRFGSLIDEEDYVPEWLTTILDDIAGEVSMREKMRKEMLTDADTRNAIFTLSIERGLMQMSQTANEALALLAERDNLVLQRNKEEERHEAIQYGALAEVEDSIPEATVSGHSVTPSLAHPMESRVLLDEQVQTGA